MNWHGEKADEISLLEEAAISEAINLLVCGREITLPLGTSCRPRLYKYWPLDSLGMQFQGRMLVDLNSSSQIITGLTQNF